MKKGILFTSEEIERIKAAKSEQCLKLKDKILNDANNAIEGDGRAPIETIGLAYCLTGDLKYFEKAKKDAIVLCEEECWTPGGLHGGSFSGRSELTSASKVIHMAYAYDIFGDLFTEEENALIIKNIYDKGIKFIYEDWVKHETRIHALDTMGHNWWVVMVSSGALAATIVKDELPEGERIARESALCCKAWFEYAGNPINSKPVNLDNGAFWEGYTYLNYSLFEYLRFANAYQKVFGESPFDDREYIKQACDFFISIHYHTESKDLFVDYGDAPKTANLTTMYYALLNGGDLPRNRWFINLIHDQFEFPYLRLLLATELEKEATPPEKLNVCYEKAGLAIFRDSYETNGTMLAVTCGDTWNHAHADTGNFVLYKNGVNEIREAGSPPSYGAKSYQGYYVQSIAHNTVLFNGRGQDYRDNFKDHAKVPGKIVNFTDKDGFRYLMADCTGPMGRFFRKHHRHFLWLDKFILIYDDIECYEKGEVNFLLHAEEKNSFRMLTPCKKSIHQGYKDKSDELNDTYTSYDLPTGIEDHAKFISVICLDDSLTPTYEEFEKYAKVTCGDTVIYVNLISDGRVMHNNCLIQADDYVTDAVILTENNGKTGAVNCSIVRKNDETVHGVWARTTGYIN